MGELGYEINESTEISTATTEAQKVSIMNQLVQIVLEQRSEIQELQDRVEDLETAEGGGD